MPETNDDNFFEDEDKSFEELLDSYSTGMNENIQVGDKIKGEIISIGIDSIYIDTGSKIDGVLDKIELLDENGDLPYSKGDSIDLYIVSLDESEIRLSKALTGQDSQHLLYDAFENKIPVEGKVAEVIKGGFHVDIMKNRAFCPISQMDIYFVKDPETFVGSTYKFFITRYEERGRNIIVSRKAFLNHDLKEARATFLNELEKEKILEARVTKLMPYGAFLELFPGIEGMAHISELSWSRVEKADDVLKEDENVRVKVIGIEQNDSGEVPKISLSLKQVDGDPWDGIEEKFQKGDTIRGKVIRLTSFGAFVEITPGVDGLVHISEMSYLKRILKPEDVVTSGELVSVMIKEIQKDNKKISLSIKDAEGDPWIGITEKYTKGQAVTGTIEKKEQFGYFINLEPGITGLFPKSKISKSYDAAGIEKMKPGDSIKIKVEEINPKERKITLGPFNATDGDDWRSFTKESPSPMGALGEKLQKALNKKDKK